MKKLLILAALLLLPSLAFAGHATNGVFNFTVSGANTVLADTGDIASNVDFPVVVRQTAICSCSVNCQIVWEHRNAADSANVPAIGGTSSQVIVVAAFKTEVIPLYQPIQMATDGESFRLRLNANITGLVQCSLFFE